MYKPKQNPDQLDLDLLKSDAWLNTTLMDSILHHQYKKMFPNGNSDQCIVLLSQDASILYRYRNDTNSKPYKLQLERYFVHKKIHTNKQPSNLPISYYLPLNFDGLNKDVSQHWFLLKLDFEPSTCTVKVIIYDSLKTKHIHRLISNWLESLVVHIAVYNGYHTKFTVSLHYEPLQIQTDTFNCGIFTIVFISYFLECLKNNKSVDYEVASKDLKLFNEPMQYRKLFYLILKNGCK